MQITCSISIMLACAASKLNTSIWTIPVFSLDVAQAIYYAKERESGEFFVNQKLQ